MGVCLLIFCHHGIRSKRRERHGRKRSPFRFRSIIATVSGFTPPAPAPADPIFSLPIPKEVDRMTRYLLAFDNSHDAPTPDALADQILFRGGPRRSR